MDRAGDFIRHRADESGQFFGINPLLPFGADERHLVPAPRGRDGPDVYQRVVHGHPADHGTTDPPDKRKGLVGKSDAITVAIAYREYGNPRFLRSLVGGAVTDRPSLFD